MDKNSLEELYKRLQINAGGAPTAKAQDNLDQVQMEDVYATPVQPQIQPVSAIPEPTAPAASGPGIAQMAQTSGTLPMGPSAEDLKLRRQIEKQMADEITTRGQEVALDKQAVQQEAGKSAFQKMDLSPLMQMAAIAGANPKEMDMYKAPVSKEAALRAQLEKSQAGLSTSQTGFLKNQLERQNVQADRNRMMQDRLNERVYGNVISGVQRDKTLNDLVDKSNTITRIADVAFSPSQDINTTSLHDLQQTVTSALSSIKGGGGIEERANRYMSDGAMAIAKLQEKFGNTDSIPRDEPILVHYMELARDGQKFIQDQAEKRLQSVAGGHENITNQPTYRAMLNQELDRVRGNIIKPQYMNTAMTNASLSPSQTGGNKTAVAKKTAVKHPSNDEINSMSAEQLKKYLGQ
jgi:hypothetical protein